MSDETETTPDPAEAVEPPVPEADSNAVADAHGLLHGPVATNDHPEKRWAYPVWAGVLISLFILYHSAILVVHNLPSKGLSADLHKLFNAKLKMRTYMQTNGNTQSWAMFAPNPHRSNVFMRVMVKDSNGEVWDMGHDIYGRRTYPYLFYDRMGKINRRILDQKGYRRTYAAWVCRDWERTRGEPADEIQFVKMWTRIPDPSEVIKRANGDLRRMGYDPMKLHLHQRDEGSMSCRNLRQAQLPNYLRERYGMPTVDESLFRPVYTRTWWDVKEAKKRGASRRPGAVGSDLSSTRRKDVK